MDGLRCADTSYREVFSFAEWQIESRSPMSQIETWGARCKTAGGPDFKWIGIELVPPVPRTWGPGMLPPIPAFDNQTSNALTWPRRQAPLTQKSQPTSPKPLTY